MPPFFSSRGAAPPGPPTRADGRARGEPTLSTLFFFTFVGPYPEIVFFLHFLTFCPGSYLISFLLKFHVECTQNHVWGPPGPRVMSIFV